MEHSKLPWATKQHGANSHSLMSGDMVLAVFKRFDMPEINKANAAFIVKACNEHDTLKAKEELFDDIASSLKRHWEHCQLDIDVCRVCEMYQKAKELTK